MKRVAILGATGSVGRSTLDLIEQHPDRFRVTAVTAATNVDALAQIARSIGAECAVIADEGRFSDLKRPNWPARRPRTQTLWLQR